MAIFSWFSRLAYKVYTSWTTISITKFVEIILLVCDVEELASHIWKANIKSEAQGYGRQFTRMGLFFKHIGFDVAKFSISHLHDEILRAGFKLVKIFENVIGVRFCAGLIN